MQVDVSANATGRRRDTYMSHILKLTSCSQDGHTQHGGQAAVKLPRVISFGKRCLRNIYYCTHAYCTDCVTQCSHTQADVRSALSSCIGQDLPGARTRLLLFDGGSTVLVVARRIDMQGCGSSRRSVPMSEQSPSRSATPVFGACLLRKIERAATVNCTRGTFLVRFAFVPSKGRIKHTKCLRTHVQPSS